MIAKYPGGEHHFIVADGSRQYVDREEGRIWYLEPNGRVRCFDSRNELVVRDDRAREARAEYFSWVALSAESAAIEPVVVVEEPIAPRVGPWKITQKPERYRKHHWAVVFYEKYSIAIPVGSRFKTTPRGVIVALPNGGARLFSPQGPVRLTAADEKALASSVPLSLRRR